MELQLTPTHEGSKRTLSNLVMDVVAPPPPVAGAPEAGPEPMAVAPPEEPTTPQPDSTEELPVKSKPPRISLP